MRINNNPSSLNTLNKMNISSKNAAKKMEKLSSGVRINRAADDAAGLSISEHMRSQIRGLEQASENAQDGIAFMQTAEAALGETHEMLQRMRELAVKAATGTNTPEDIQAMQDEIDQLGEEITRIANDTKYNGIKPLVNDPHEIVTFQIGANAEQSMEVQLVDATAKGLDLDPFPRVDTDPDDAITKFDDAIKLVTEHRSRLSGSVTNRLEYAVNNLQNMASKLSEAESLIRDADIAKEMVELTKENVLQEAAQAMLAQGNQQIESVIQLLR